MIELTTKTFGKAAKKEALKILNQPYSANYICGSYVLRSKTGVMLGHVTEGDIRTPKAFLVLC